MRHILLQKLLMLGLSRVSRKKRHTLSLMGWWDCAENEWFHCVPHQRDSSEYSIHCEKIPISQKITPAPLLMLSSVTNMRYVCVTFDNLILCHIGYCVVDGASPLQSDEWANICWWWNQWRKGLPRIYEAMITKGMMVVLVLMEMSISWW